MAAKPADIGPVPEEEFYSMAAALEVAVARRYRYLAAWWEAHGHRPLTALFDRLAAGEQNHVKDVLAQCPGASITPLHRAGQPPLLGEAAWRSALKTPHLALALAAREEEWACLFYGEVARRAATPGLRALAGNLAQGEREHAELLREARRGGLADSPSYAPPVPTRGRAA